MASIFKQKGRPNWYISYFYNGKRYTKNSGTPYKKLAEEVASHYASDISRGSHKEIQKTSTVRLYREYLTAKKNRKKRTNTNERCIIKSFLRFLSKRMGKLPPVNEVSTNDIRSFMRQYDSRQPETYNNVLGTLKRFFSRAVKLNMVFTNPVDDVERKKLTEKQVKAFSDSEYMRIEKASVGNPIYPMILTARYTGLRLAEMIHLEWEDVDFERRVVYVKNKADHTTKNYRGRAIPLSLEFIEKLKPFVPPLDDRRGFCFHPFKFVKTKVGAYYKTFNGKKYAEQGPKRVIVKILKDAGVYERGKAFHRLRKTFATALKNQGVAVALIAEWLGHGGIKVTERYLADVGGYHPEIEKLSLDRNEALSEKRVVGQFESRRG